MTFDAAVNTDFGTMLADLRDKVSGMTNWSLYEDNTAGGASAYDTSFVFETPTGEYIKVGDNAGALSMEYGSAYDTGTSSWTTQYNNPSHKGMMPAEHMSPGNYVETDATKYWLEYVADKGFMLYYTREEGDGNDGAVYGGFAKLTKLWDYDAATAEEGDYVSSWAGYRQGEEYTTEAWNTPANGLTNNGSDNEHTIHAKGCVNPDANYANYPVAETNVLASTTFENASGREAFIGTHDLWAIDRSGNDSSHLDTITIGGVDTYTVLKEYSASGPGVPFAMRMD